jgi:hypothetical protein
MNTKLALTDTTGPREDTDDVRTRPRRRRALRRVAALVLSGALAVLGMTATATPASAATSVTYCFVNAYGQPYALSTTSWYVFYNGYWHFMQEDTTSRTGCSTINTYWYAGYHIMVKAGTFGGRVYGDLPYIARPGSGQAYLGTGVAHLPYI